MRKRLLRSRSGFEKPESREEAIMQNILGASNVLEPSESNIEEILKSILYNTPYTKEAEFDIEKILLAIKNNGTYDGECESRDLKILFAILNDIDYTKEAESRIEELFIEWHHQRSSIKVLEGIPPLTFVAKGEPLINYEISGNMIQSGTPSPDTPIMPQGTGERTGNLWNAEGFSAIAITSTHEHTNTNSYGTTISSTIGKEVSVTQANYPTGNVGYQNGFFFLDVDFSKYSIGDVITLSFDYTVDDVHALSTQTTTTLYVGANSNRITPTLTSGDWKISGRLIVAITIIANMNPYVEVRLCGNSITVKNIMLNTGSTALPYEPYGIKIPISSANTMTPVYLGEVQSTRRIYKYEFTGSETWSADTGNYYSWVPQTYGDGVPYSAIICSHCSNATINNTGKAVFFKKTDFPDITTGEELKQYCSNQYANGTPVTVWYVLAAEETAVVNEPLMRIGDYADTLSMEQAGVEIPTVNGSNTLDVDTTLKPSNVYIEYK